ncbi:MAG: hypothetical protein MI750_00915 [Xanthomonadales bacterium]|nr:hypothetical protein [Xanthomonadales bacterium]
MNRDDVMQYQLVERYVRNRLDESTRKAFEIFLLDSPETLEEVRIEEALYQGMKAQSLVPAPLPLAHAKPRHPARLPYALAAAFAVLAVTGFSLSWQQYIENDLLRQQMNKPWIDARFLRLETVRAVDDFKTAERIVFDERMGARLFIQLEPISYDFNQVYRVDVMRLNEGDRVNSGRHLVVSYQARVNEAGYLQTEVPFQHLTPGFYYLKVNDLQEDAFREYKLVVE